MVSLNRALLGWGGPLRLPWQIENHLHQVHTTNSQQNSPVPVPELMPWERHRTKTKGYFGKCSTPVRLLICLSFNRENCHLLLMNHYHYAPTSLSALQARNRSQKNQFNSHFQVFNVEKSTWYGLQTYHKKHHKHIFHSKDIHETKALWKKKPTKINRFGLSWMRGNHQTQTHRFSCHIFLFTAKVGSPTQHVFRCFFQANSWVGRKTIFFFHYGFVFLFFPTHPEIWKKTQIGQDVELGKFTISTKISVGPKIRPPKNWNHGPRI